MILKNCLFYKVKWLYQVLYYSLIDNNSKPSFWLLYAILNTNKGFEGILSKIHDFDFLNIFGYFGTMCAGEDLNKG